MDALGSNESESSESSDYKTHLAQWLSGAFEGPSPSPVSISVDPIPSPPQGIKQEQQASRSTEGSLSPGAVVDQSVHFHRQTGRLPDSQFISTAPVSSYLLVDDANNSRTNIANLGPETGFQSNAAYRPSTVYNRPSVQVGPLGPLLFNTPQSPLPIHCPKPVRLINFTPSSPVLDQPLLAPAPMSISHPWEARAHRHLIVPRQRVHYMNQILTLAMHGTQINPDGGVTVYYCQGLCCRALCDLVGLHRQ